MLASTCWAVVPAAGIGSRMQTEQPKQYLQIHGKTVIEYSIQVLLSHPAVAGVMVALQAGDRYFPTLEWPGNKPVLTALGGEQRVDSVLNGLRALREHVDDNTWVLVHDAARPCLQIADIDALIEHVVARNACGGLLAMPVRDTMKRADADGFVAQTVARDALWHAQTPQMFRYAQLVATLQSALQHQLNVTDECSAFEYQGETPLLVACGAHNLKITHPEDLQLAESFLRRNGVSPSWSTTDG